MDFAVVRISGSIPRFLPVFTGEQPAGAAKTGLYLVRYQQNAVLVTDVPQCFYKGDGGRNKPTFPLERLDYYGCHVFLAGRRFRKFPLRFPRTSGYRPPRSFLPVSGTDTETVPGRPRPGKDPSLWNKLSWRSWPLSAQSGRGTLQKIR